MRVQSVGNDFGFFMSIEPDLAKSESEGKRIIKGFASTPDMDRQGESIMQKGLDISDLVSGGFFNYDHDNTKIVGYPNAQTCIKSEGLWVEGEILKGVPLADHVWEVAVALQKSNAPRRWGFSVEGKVTQRDGTKIVKAKLYNIAITPNPVNPKATWDAVVKSFTTGCDQDVLKALNPGYATCPEDKVDGSALEPEDLESAIKKLAPFGSGENKKKIKEMLANKSLNADETILYFQLTKGWSRQQVIDFLQKVHN